MVIRIGNKTYGDRSQTGMTEQAETEPDVTDTDEGAETQTNETVTPAAPASEPQLSQQQANYRMGSPLVKCGNCVYYNVGDETYQFGRCDQVTGSISTYGNCDIYRRIANPFPAALNPQEFAQMENYYWQKAREKGIPDQRASQQQADPRLAEAGAGPNQGSLPSTAIAGAPAPPRPANAQMPARGGAYGAPQ